MKTIQRMQFVDDVLLKMNAFFGGVLYGGIKLLARDHRSTTSSNGCDAEDYETKYARVSISACLTFLLLVDSAMIQMAMKLVRIHKPETLLKYLKGDLFALGITVVSHIGLMVVGFFLIQYYIAGIACGCAN